MSSIDYLQDLGLSVDLAGGGRLRIRGLKQLKPEVVSSALEYAKQRKHELLEDLSTMWGLPEACPLLGGPVPDECSFEEKFFRRMVREDVLPIDGKCPLRRVCKLS